MSGVPRRPGPGGRDTESVEPPSDLEDLFDRTGKDRYAYGQQRQLDVWSVQTTTKTACRPARVSGSRDNGSSSQSRACDAVTGAEACEGVREMRVEQLMTRNVVACRPEDSLARAAQLLLENDCGCIPVVDRYWQVVGIVTDRDALRVAYTKGELLPEIAVASAMTARVFCCRPEDTILCAEDLMTSYRVRRLPVTDDDGRLVGILSLDDIAREAARERSQSTRQVSDAEVGETFAAVCGVGGGDEGRYY